MSGWKIDPPKDRPILAVVQNLEFVKGFGGAMTNVERVVVVEWSPYYKGYVLVMGEASEYDPETYPVLRWQEVPSL